MSSISSFSMLRHSASAPQLTRYQGDGYDGSALRDAAKRGDLALVKAIARSGLIDLNELDDEYMTPLTLAAENGHLDVVRYLIEECKVPPYQNDDNEYHFCPDPLIAAARCGRLEVVQYLVEIHKADVNSQHDGKDYDTVIAHAISSGNEELVRYLASRPGIDLRCGLCDYDALGYAAKKGHLGIVKLLVEEIGMDPHEGVVEGNIEKYSAMFLAIHSNELAVVEWFVKNNPECVNHMSQQGYTPLSLAISMENSAENFEIIKCLVENGADIGAIVDEVEGLTALSLAAKIEGGELVVAYLIEALLAQE